MKYKFLSSPWQYNSNGGWVFVSLPLTLSKEIREHFQQEEQGWGRLKVTAQTGNSVWKSSIWWDSKTMQYLLPLKAEVRIKENIIIDFPIDVIITI
ncbi:MAG: DUF1905 domain-containing protein [Saprospiraceae bacterium]|nr:DUF1905 domain-containing protein [Saprospiraceae bacterium]MBL0025874.1 DUF1905 domain-containing protein [Saprospiraceae bacterium]